ncbi:integral membrane regulator [Streptomyces sp. SID14478]|uniref:Pr6Pr family membrane protein n=1 Tax=Streptomyces sp. SID14478 TaxID=2706073 RepID=UPI0013DB686A|nr:Pr6Pr family membrane protein [Streptomyces sp. SID14478]NEB76276.1 integral membrane regulator [Streptomyces sp. SID14478]
MIAPSSAASVPAEAVVPQRRRPVAAAFRALVALAALTGIVIDLSISDSALRVLSYFTIQSNILVAVAFALSAWRAWTARPPLRPLVTGGVLLFICITGLVYHVILANSASGFSMTDDPDVAVTGARQVSNQLLHTVTPIGAVLDWLLLTRPGALRPRHAAIWLAYPLAYFGFALARGAIMTPGTPARYPYPFLDVDAHGYAGVLGNAVIFGLAFYVLALALVLLDRIRPEIRGPENRISPQAAGPLK